MYSRLMEISSGYSFSLFVPTTDLATEASPGVGLRFAPIELEEVTPGMTLRFKDIAGETIVSTVRIEQFSPVDDALVVDTIYPNARLSSVFEDYYEVAVLKLA